MHFSYLTFLLVYLFRCASSLRRIDSLTMPMGKLVKFYGYPYENHTVLADSGYYLTVGRIPYVQDRYPPGVCKEQKGTVVMAHGFASNSDSFIYAGKNQSLGLQLSDDCYDVWLTHNRGTRYSTQHVKWKRSDRAFWNTTLDELAYDMANILDRILTVTNQSNLHAVTFSKGSTEIMMLLSRFPSYQKRFSSLHFMAPIYSLQNVESHVLDGVPFSFLYALSKYASDLVALPTSSDFHQIANEELCVRPWSFNLCGLLEHYQAEAKADEVEVRKMWSSYFPDKQSLKTLMHLGQILLTGNFSMYNYGAEGNLAMYGMESPPIYHVETIQVPVHLYYSTGDIFSARKDAEVLATKLPDVRLKHLIKNSDYGHGDFLITYFNNTDIIYSTILKELDKFKNHA